MKSKLLDSYWLFAKASIYIYQYLYVFEKNTLLNKQLSQEYFVFVTYPSPVVSDCVLSDGKNLKIKGNIWITNKIST